MCGCSFLISLDSYLFRTYEFTDKTPQIAEEQLVMTMDKAQKQNLKDIKVSLSMFSADISKSKEISRWRPIDKTLHCSFSATRTFFKNRHKFLSEGLAFFPAMGSTRRERKLSPRLRKNRHTHTHTDTQTHKPIAITYTRVNNDLVSLSTADTHIHTKIHYYKHPSAYAQVKYDTVLTNQVRADEMIL